MKNKLSKEGAVNKGDNRVVEFAAYLPSNHRAGLNSTNDWGGDMFSRFPLLQRETPPLGNSVHYRTKILRIEAYKQRLEQIRAEADAKTETEGDKKLGEIYSHSWLVDLLLDALTYMAANDLDRPAEGIFTAIENLLDQFGAE